MTHPLLERGFAVTAVDGSAEMLARIRGARAVRAPADHTWTPAVPALS